MKLVEQLVAELRRRGVIPDEEADAITRRVFGPPPTDPVDGDSLFRFDAPPMEDSAG